MNEHQAAAQKVNQKATVRMQVQYLGTITAGGQC